MFTFSIYIIVLLKSIDSCNSKYWIIIHNIFSFIFVELLYCKKWKHYTLYCFWKLEHNGQVYRIYCFGNYDIVFLCFSNNWRKKYITICIFFLFLDFQWNGWMLFIFIKLFIQKCRYRYCYNSWKLFSPITLIFRIWIFSSLHVNSSHYKFLYIPHYKEIR